MQKIREDYHHTKYACYIGYIVQAIVNNFVPLFVDRIGYRASMLAAVVVYAVGGGLLEVLVSPIVEACLTEQKESDFLIPFRALVC